MDLPALKSLIQTMAALDLDKMAVERGGWVLAMRREMGGGAEQLPALSAAPASPAELPEIRAPLAGVLHLRPAPDAPPFVVPGQRVQPGEVVCIIEAMKVFNQVRSERDGEVVAVLAESGTEVLAGQPLMRLA